MDIHNYEGRLKREENLLKRSKIVKENKELILEFKKELIAAGISIPRVVRYMQTLRVISQIVNKPFSEWGKDDLVEVLSVIETRNYTIQTKNEFRKGMRKFFKWLKGEEWKPLKLLKGDRKDKRKPETLTEEEIIAMIEAANHPRDKAFIALAYEAGLRIGELAGLKIRDVTWNERGARIRVRGKTGDRVIPVVMAAPYLRRWLDVHPLKDPDSYVFCSLSQRNFAEPLEYQSLTRMVKDAARRAGIKKRVYPHILRHSRASKLANYLTESQMSQYFGWVQGSDMPRVYVHLSGRDIEKAIYRMYGMEEEEEVREEVRPIKCPRCGYVNAPTDRFCGRCALVLDERERLKLEMEEAKVASEMLNAILQDPSTIEKLREMIAFVEKIRENPEYIRMLIQLRDEFEV